MGTYLPTNQTNHNARTLIDTYGALEVPFSSFTYANIPDGQGLVCVVNNGQWEAALYCDTELEFIRSFPRVNDNRPRTYLYLDLDTIESLLEGSGK